MLPFQNVSKQSHGQVHHQNLYIQQLETWQATLEDQGLPYQQPEYNTWILRMHERNPVSGVHYFTNQTKTITRILYVSPKVRERGGFNETLRKNQKAIKTVLQPPCLVP